MKNSIKCLLSLPPNVVKYFHRITGLEPEKWYCTSDPVGHRIGSGGGTAWLLESCRRAEAPELPFSQWLCREKRILMHAGGLGRRIPAYAPSGKVLTPIPVLRWERGQRIDQTLLDFQTPLLRRVMENAPDSLHTLVASGDVLIRQGRLERLPEADVVCLGLWENPELAQNHGVFMMNRDHSDRLDFMLQKPTPEELACWTETHFFLMDIGVWLLSDKAVEALMICCRNEDGTFREYDLYSDFGRALGEHPTHYDGRLADLTVAVVPMPEGEFYHYGTSRELISSTEALMNLVKDQRFIMQRNMKHHPSIFIQNSIVQAPLKLDEPNIWIENSYLSEHWTLSRGNIVTGVPQNDWKINLKPGQCVDVVPIGEKEWAVRPYGFEDVFRGALADEATLFLGRAFKDWARKHGVEIANFGRNDDLQRAELFPVCESIEEIGQMLTWFLDDEAATQNAETERWRNARRLSAEELVDKANLWRLEQQRKMFRKENMRQLAKNYRKSVFYQLDLHQAAYIYYKEQLPLPAELPESVPLLTQIHDAMFRSDVLRFRGENDLSQTYDKKAFDFLREGMVAEMRSQKSMPHLSVYPDQIVWGRSAVRIDIAGGWTDTPPYTLMNGGNVVNMAIHLNGQQPLQVYVRPNKNYNIVCRSIDLGSVEVITTFEELASFNKVGSPFSIPKAALGLAGFLPDFCAQVYPSLRSQLEDFGSGIDITLLSAVPAGSGLGTSSILSATVLGGLSDFCGLGWSKNEICNRTLVLEQMLTTGGGWQDQFGGVLHGVKLLQTEKGFRQTPSVSWLPETIFRREDYRACHLLYYTGLTRTAKKILAEIVRRMFLNENEQLRLLSEMKEHALEMQAAIQRDDFQKYGRLLRYTWKQNQLLDDGTCPPDIARLSARIDDLTLGYKLPGAGGGGYMYMVAKDPEAAALIRQRLTEQPLTPSARFVDMTLSEEGMQVSRS